MKLAPCGACGSAISVTALECPQCGWLVPVAVPDSGKSKGLAWAGASIALLALGPAAVVGGFGALVASALDGSVADRRKRAREIGAIDGFPLSDLVWGLVTKTSIWIGYEEVPFERWVRAELDEGASRTHKLLREGRAVMRITRMTDYRAQLRDIFKRRQMNEVTEDYVLTGEDAFAQTRFAKLKLDEYVFDPRAMSLPLKR